MNRATDAAGTGDTAAPVISEACSGERGSGLSRPTRGEAAITHWSFNLMLHNVICQVCLNKGEEKKNKIWLPLRKKTCFKDF